jgi:hypothetical protein
MLIVILFSLYAVMTIASLQSTYGQTSRLSNAEVVGTSNKNNVTILNASALASNMSIPSPGPPAILSMENLSQTSPTNLTNPIGVEDIKGAKINSTEENKTVKYLNLTSLANNRQFSLGNLLNNSTSDNSTSVNDTAHNASVTFKLTIEAPTSSNIPMESLVTRSGFEGISTLNAGNMYDPVRGVGAPSPPDAQIAVSADHIVELVNSAGAYFTRHGEAIPGASPFNLTGFFNASNPSPHSLSDPRIMYDNSTKTWFAIILDKTDNTVRLAVSAGPDPVKKWKIWPISFGGKGNCPDEPKLGMSRDKLVVIANVMKDCNSLANSDSPKDGECHTPKCGQFRVFDKHELINGIISPKNYTTKQLTDFNNLHVARLTNFNDTSDLYLVKFNTDDSDSVANSISVIRISGKVPDVTLTSSSLTVQTATKTQNLKIAASRGGELQPPAPGIDTGFLTVEDAYWHDGKMWLTGSNLCQPKKNGPLLHCIRLIQVDTRSLGLPVIQDFDVYLRGKDLFYPAVAINSQGDLGMVFAYSSRQDYPGVFATTQSANSAKNRLDGIIPILPSISFSNKERYGDYFGIVVDPIIPKQFWSVSEFIPVSYLAQVNGIPFWSTFIANFTSPTTTSISSSTEIP